MEYRKLATTALIEKCVEKDPLAWAEFVNRFAPLITFSIKKALSKYSADRGSSGEDIKEIRQNIMASLWAKNKLDEVKQRNNIDYWLVITARNAAINHLKAKRKDILITDQSYFERFPQEQAKIEIGESKIESSDQKLKDIYKLLTPKEKIIFKFHFKKELKLKDISKIMGISIGTVSSIVTRMRKKIRFGK